MGRKEHCKQISLACVGSSRSVSATLGLPHTLSMCAFPVYTAQASDCSAAELSKAGPGLCALPSSKLLRFRFLGSPQRHRLSWACILCFSQVRAAQVIRCLVSALSQVGGASYHHPGPSHSVSWVSRESALSSVPCVSSGELISDCDPLVDVNHLGSQEDLVSNWEPACSLVEDDISGAEIAPFWLWLSPFVL